MSLEIWPSVRGSGKTRKRWMKRIKNISKLGSKESLALSGRFEEKILAKATLDKVGKAV